MRLLSRNEAIEGQSRDKAREIAEGLKVARKVDSLRELHATEEKQFSDFRDKTLATIGEEIRLITEKRENAIAELRIIENEIEAKRPYLDQKEKELEEERLLAEKNKKSSEKILSSLVYQRKEINKNKEEAAALKIRTLLQEQEAARLQEESIRKEAESQKTLELVRNDREIFEKNKNETDATTVDMLLALAAWRDKLKEREALIEEERKKNDKDKIWIADRRAMLQRNFERLKKLQNNGTS